MDDHPGQIHSGSRLNGFWILINRKRSKGFEFLLEMLVGAVAAAVVLVVACGVRARTGRCARWRPAPRKASGDPGRVGSGPRPNHLCM